MLDFIRTASFWRWASAAFFVAAISLLLIGCSSMVPAFQADLEDIQKDQAASAEAAAEGDWVRATISGLLALAGSVTYAVSRQKKYDRAPFEGKVGDEMVKVTEDEMVKAVMAAKSDGKI